MGAGAGGRRPRPPREGPRVNEHREVLWPSAPKDLGAEVDSPVPHLQAGAQGDKRKTRTPTPAPVKGP